MAASYPENHPSHYSPSETALLLLDYHQMMISMVPTPEPCHSLLSSTQALLSAARSSGSPVLHCLIDVNGTPRETSKVVQRWNTVYSQGLNASPEVGAEHKDLAAPEGTDETFFTRAPGIVSALKSPGIRDYLREKGIKSLVLCGVATGGCVLSTAKEGSDEGFVVSVVREGCWDPSPEVHEALLGKTLVNSGWVFGVEDGGRILRGEGVENKE